MGVEIRPGLSRGGIALALLGVLVAIALFGVNWIAGFLTCGQDTSYCADSTEKHGAYRGILVHPDGEPYASGEFSVTFTSLSRAGLPSVDFTTDERGAFCIQWPREPIVPSVSPSSLRVAGQELFGLREWTELRTDEPVPGCQTGDAEIPWDRASTLESSWQYRLAIGLPLLALVGFVSALVAHRSPNSRRFVIAGAALLAGSALATPLIWF